VTLSWLPGEFVGELSPKHKVFFSENINDVKEGIGGITQDANSYTPPQLLDFGKTYYWRVDEANSVTGWDQGEFWSFTTEPYLFVLPAEVIDANASSFADEYSLPENTINGSGLDEDGLLHTTNPIGTMWLADPAGPQPPWIEYTFVKGYSLQEMAVWNHNGSLGILGIKDAQIEYSPDGVEYVMLGTYEFAKAPGADLYQANTLVDFGGVLAQKVRITAQSGYAAPGMVGLSEVQFKHLPLRAYKPKPEPNSTDVGVDITLSWQAGRQASSHEVHFSDSNQAVIDSNALVATVSETSYDTGELDLAQTYYWKVNEVNEAATPTTWKGDVLSFSTQEFLVVDDFEGYNDFEPDRIFDTWIDGWADPANGSQVGSDAPPFAEQTIVRSGSQAMALHYDNTTAGYSEATVNIANLAIGQDWTKHGIKTLTLYFNGDPNNSVERMYVKLNGSKVIYDGDASDIARIGWPPWNIELASFGVNLRNVTELSIGLERSGAAGGKGVVYFDDIRLYPYSRQLLTPVEPAAAGMVGHWQFEGNFNDSSGNNGHGTPFGSPAFEAGKVGQAINLRGANDYVEITGYKGILGPNDFSITAWVKSTSTGDVTMVCWGTQAGGQRVDFRLYMGRLRVEHGNGSLQGNTMLADGQWHHVAVTVSENASISYPAVKLYLDGNDDSRTTTDPDTFNIVANIDVNIGRRGTNNDRLFSGSLDEVRIYERVLTHEEIAGLAGRTQPFDKPF
jgi:hypothetical protein